MVLSIGSNILHSVVPKSKIFRLFDLLPRPPDIDISLVDFPLKIVTYNCKTMEVAIETAPLHKLSLLPGIIEVDNAIISCNASLDLKKLGLTYLKMTATWNVAGIAIQADISYNPVFRELKIKGELKSAITVYLDSVIRKLTGVSLKIPLPSFTLHHVAIDASIDTFDDGDSTIALSGSIDNNRVYTIFQKSVSSGEKGKYSVAFAADLVFL